MAGEHERQSKRQQETLPVKDQNSQLQEKENYK